MCFIATSNRSICLRVGLLANLPPTFPPPPSFLPTHSLTCLDKDEFAVCGHGMGPNMAAGAAKLERCKERGGVGPFPFASGTLEVCA